MLLQLTALDSFFNFLFSEERVEFGVYSVQGWLEAWAVGANWALAPASTVNSGILSWHDGVFGGC